MWFFGHLDTVKKVPKQDEDTDNLQTLLHSRSLF